MKQYQKSLQIIITCGVAARYGPWPPQLLGSCATNKIRNILSRKKYFLNIKYVLKKFRTYKLGALGPLLIIIIIMLILNTYTPKFGENKSKYYLSVTMEVTH